MPSTLRDQDIQTPKPAEIELAKESSRKLAPYLRKGNDLRLQIKNGRDLEELILPQHVARKLLDMLTEVGMGNAVQLSTLQPEISTQQAADLLNVSRPYVVKLVEEGAIPSRKIGPRRFLLLNDVMTYKKQMYKDRLGAMNELTRLSQELGLYDEPEK
ncbi:MAG: excisionase family DNA-binding protein [Gemmataceae bacterium]